MPDEKTDDPQFQDLTPKWIAADPVEKPPRNLWKYITAFGYLGMLVIPLVPVSALATFVLLTLQLMGEISISWFWVWLPVGLPLAVAILSILALLLVQRADPELLKSSKRLVRRKS